MPADAARARDVFLAAADLPDADRLTHIADACGTDAELRAEVERLLAAHDRGGWLGCPNSVGEAGLLTAALGTTDASARPREEVDPIDAVRAVLDPPTEAGALGRLDHYEVLAVVGRGGFGTVLRARDTKLGRDVAVKVLAPRAAAHPDARRRFVREARAAAAVHSDHVVAVHAVRDDGPVPYLVMEFVAGGTLADRLRGGPLPPREAARVGAEAARGLAAAHARGLIHRDVKPANILLDADTGRARITDFGLARDPTDDDVRVTADGALVGTPAYMSPEQARSHPLDARTDLFSLGVVLYQATTGELPFRGGDVLGVLSALALDAPAPPAVKNPRVPAALSALVMRLLAKDAAARPATAAAVADELGRIAAAPDDPPARPRRRWKWVAAGGLAAVLVALAAAQGPTVVRVVTNRGELVIEVDDPTIEVTVKDGAARVFDKTTGREFVLTAGDGEVEFHDPQSGAKALTKVFRVERGGRAVVRATRAELLAARPAAPAPNPPAPNPPAPVAPTYPVVRCDGWIALSPDGTLLAVPLGYDNPDVLVLDAATGMIRHRLVSPAGGRGRSVRAAFTPDGTRLLTANSDHNAVVVWRLADGKAVHTLPTQGGPLAVAVRPGGKQVAVTGQRDVRVYDLDTGAFVRARTVGPGNVHGLAYSPAGDRLAAVSEEGGAIKVWDADTGAEVMAVGGLPQLVGVAFSPDGRWVAAGGHDNLRVWEVATRKSVLARDDGRGCSWVAFDPAGRLWTGPWHAGNPAYRLQRWDVAAGTRADVPVPHVEHWPSFALTADGATVLVSDAARGIWACDAATGRPRPASPARPGPAPPLALPGAGNTFFPAWSGDGTRLAIAKGNTVRLFDPRTGVPLNVLSGVANRVGNVAVSPNGKLVAATEWSTPGPVRLWDADAAWNSTLLGEKNVSYRHLAFGADGGRLAVVANTVPPGVVQWDVGTRAPLRTLRGGAAAFTSLVLDPRGKWVAAHALDNKVWVWNPDTGDVIRELDGVKKSANNKRSALSADGRWLAVGTVAGVRVWDTTTWAEVTTLTKPGVWTAFSPDGLTLYAAERHDIQPFGAGTVTRWDTRTWQELPPVELPGGAQLVFDLSPDGRTLYHMATNPADAALKAFDLSVLPTAGRMLPVAPPPRAAGTAPPAADRAALEWVLDVGGWIDIPGWPELRLGVRLPDGPFQVRRLSLEHLPDLEGVIGKQLRDLPPVTSRLILTGSSVADADIAALARCPGLRDTPDMDPSYTRLTGKGLAHLAGFPGLRALLLNQSPVLRAADLRALRGLELTELSLDRIPVGDDTDVLATLPLQHLHLEDTGTTDVGLAKLRPLAGLRALTMSGLGVTGKSVDVLTRFPELELLVLPGADLSDADAARLAKALPKLEHLNLSGARVGDTAAAVIAAHCRGLKTLMLDGTAVGDAGLKALAALPALRVLSVAGNGARVGDIGLSHLSGCASLQDLNAHGTAVTRGGAVAFVGDPPRRAVRWSEG